MLADSEHHYGIADGLLYDEVTDPNRHSKQTRYDTFGRLVEVYELSGDCGDYWPEYSCGGQHNTQWAVYSLTSYSYDVLDHLTDVWDAANNHTQIGYDPLGRKTSMTDPDMGSWSYSYDDNGNLFTQTDARGCTTTFSYDALDRLTGKTYSGPGACGTTAAVTYHYDQSGHGAGAGRCTSMDDALGTASASWTYDQRGRVTAEQKTIDSVAYTTGYTYRADDQVQTMTYPDNEVVTTAYDAAGRPATLQGTLSGQFTDFPYAQSTSYAAAGRVELQVLGSNVLRVDPVHYPWTTVNGQGRLQRIQTGTPSNATSLQDLRYSYDAVGNIARLEDWKAGAPQAVNFSYDDLDRLTNASGAYNESYGYNASGNLTTKSDMGSYAYNAGKPHAVSSAGNNSYGYDANGNQAARIVDGTTYVLTYDAENRLVSYSGGGVTASFVYDGDGHRVKATFNGTTTIYVGDYYEKTGSKENAECRMMNDECGTCGKVFIIPHSAFIVWGGRTRWCRRRATRRR